VLFLLLPLALYLVLRARALVPAGFEGMAEEAPAMDEMLDTLQVPGIKRLLYLVGLWYESFKLMVWPSPITILHPYIPAPARYIGLALHLALIPLVFFMIRRKQYGLVMGLAFFYIALLPASRIIGDPKVLPHMAERYLYFPSIGLAIALAFGFSFLARRFKVTALASAVALALIVLTPITWARNAVWASDVQLFQSEYDNGNYSDSILVWLTAAHLKLSHYQRVAEICDQYVATQKREAKLSTHCAVAYSRQGRLQEAERAYLFGTKKRAVRAIAHANLARFYLEQNRWTDAKKQFELAVEAEKLPANRAFRQGHMLVRLYPRDRAKLLEAKALFEESLEIQPSFAPARQWLARVDQALGLR
jgi:tetratricopeptide (TPR) repeat protein